MEYLNIIYRGAGTGRLYTAYFNGTKWQGNKTISSQKGGISPTSHEPPSAVELNNWLYVFYKDTSTNDIRCCWHDGIQWHGGKKISDMDGAVEVQSRKAPHAAVFKGRILICYLDPASENGDIRTAEFDGTAWYGGKKISEQPGDVAACAKDTPAICSFHTASGEERVFLIYPHGSSHELYVASFNSVYWFGHEPISTQPGGISPKSGLSPAAAVLQDKMHIIYVSNTHLSWALFSAHFDGTTWFGDTKIEKQPGSIDPASNERPGADVFDGKLYLVYKGFISKDLYSATFDGITWAGNKKIKKQAGKLDPASKHTPAVALSVTVPSAAPNWMQKLPDGLRLCDVNIPGTHDSAAVNSSAVFNTSPYACHNTSIANQLEYGIRLLDIRLKIKPDGNSWTFITCHGNLDHPSIHVPFTNIKLSNEYEPFESVLTTCRNFLKTNDKEVIVMSLKIDDDNAVKWSDLALRRKILDALTALVHGNGNPIYDFTGPKADMPTLGSARGKIYLLNRIDLNLKLGVPIGWNKPTTGRLAEHEGMRSFTFYVQDKWEGLNFFGSAKQKLGYVTDAFAMKNKPDKKTGNTYDVVYNFASATWFKTQGIYIQPLLLNYFLEKPVAKRPRTFGWTLFDYAFDDFSMVYKFKSGPSLGANIVSLIISSNDGYKTFLEPEMVQAGGKDET